MSKSLEQHLRETCIAIGHKQAHTDLINVLSHLSHKEMPIELMEKIFDAMKAKRVEREKSND
ncbi:MAG: hypothetical protein GY941_11460 [Planctomycetes bacterium]|nr:hypothetical protein [Planctomycetota bacterium]